MKVFYFSKASQHGISNVSNQEKTPIKTQKLLQMGKRETRTQKNGWGDLDTPHICEHSVKM